MRYANRLKLYLCQTVSYEEQNGPNIYGNVGYLDPIELKARIENTHKMVRDSKGETVTSDTTVFLVHPVKPLDKINGKEIISVADMVDRKGNVCGWEAYL